MSVQIESNEDELKFTLSDLNVSIANSLRRTIISNIPCVVFKTSPYEENQCDIKINTTRFNNEIVKQRLSCIPIHITDLNTSLENYLLVINKKNESDTIQNITTEDFKILNTTTDKFIEESEIRKIFPPNSYTKRFIDFVRLKPKTSNDLEGEELSLTCKFTIASAKEDGMFNVASTISFGNTKDNEKNKKLWSEKEVELLKKGITPEEISFEKQNWNLLEAQRIFKPNSFDFIIESVGVFKNVELVKLACNNLIERLLDIKKQIETNKLIVKPSEVIMENSFDIILENEDYTIGKILEYYLYSTNFENNKTLSYCGFIKKHPFDTYSIIRIAFKEKTEKTGAYQYLLTAIQDSVLIIEQINSKF